MSTVFAVPKKELLSFLASKPVKPSSSYAERSMLLFCSVSLATAVFGSIIGIVPTIMLTAVSKLKNLFFIVVFVPFRALDTKYNAKKILFIY